MVDVNNQIDNIYKIRCIIDYKFGENIINKVILNEIEIKDTGKAKFILKVNQEDRVEAMIGDSLTLERIDDPDKIIISTLNFEWEVSENLEIWNSVDKKTLLDGFILINDYYVDRWIRGKIIIQIS